MELEGKIVIITGANQGIGRTIAVTLAEAGADIVAVDVVKNDDTASLVQAIEEMGRTCLPMQTDVSSEEEVNALIKETLGEPIPIS